MNSQTLGRRLAAFAMVAGVATILHGCACFAPVVPEGVITVLDDATGAAIYGANVTVTIDGTTITFMPRSGSDANAFAGEYVTVGSPRGMTGTVHVDAPGYRVFERALSGSDFASPTGCGQVVRLTARLGRP